MDLRDARLQKNITQEQAAKLIGVTRRTYINYESGKIDKDSCKYKYILELIKKYNLIDEEHGILTIDEIKKDCLEIFKNYSIKYCYLFGSYSKGKANEKSDVDLLISSNITGLQFFELVEILREKLGKKVDLIEISQLENNLELIEEILKDGIKIYG